MGDIYKHIMLLSMTSLQGAVMNISEYAESMDITIPTPDFEFNELGNGSEYNTGAEAAAPGLTLVGNTHRS